MSEVPLYLAHDEPRPPPVDHRRDAPPRVVVACALGGLDTRWSHWLGIGAIGLVDCVRGEDGSTPRS